ncbi:uncharacterized protein TrAtP1_011786 [Trichoderma atroviride]|uniref:uncharacterized protein n=1 Tax=Hypocrea atroviridis TaxID=63577 RepID=UPI00332E1F2B|nr:hypothetical protein TrAtP1_011786 [Trichoderma atroviride]
MSTHVRYFWVFLRDSETTTLAYQWTLPSTHYLCTTLVIRGASKTPVFQPAVELYWAHSFSPLALFLERNMGAIKHEVPVWTGAPASPMAPLPLSVPAAVSFLLVMI